MGDQGKYFCIRSHQNDLCLDVSGAELNPGQKVITWDHHGAHNQLWWYDRVHHCIRSRMDNDYVLTCESDELTIAPWERGNSAQQWDIQDERIHLKDEPDTVLDITGGEDPGAKVGRWAWHGGPNQCWKFEHVEPRYMYIRSGMNDKVLDLKDESPEAGTKVVTWDEKEGAPDCQLWYEDRNGYIRNKLTGFALDMDDGKIRCNPFEDKESQHWIHEGKTICNFDDRDQCLDIKKEKDKNGASMIQYQFFNQSNQQWSVQYIDTLPLIH